MKKHSTRYLRDISAAVICGHAVICALMLFIFYGCSNFKVTHQYPLAEMQTAEAICQVLNPPFYSKSAEVALESKNSPFTFFENYSRFYRENNTDSLAIHFIERPSDYELQIFHAYLTMRKRNSKMTYSCPDSLHAYLQREVPTEDILFNYYLKFWLDQTDSRKLYFHKDIPISKIGLKNKMEKMVFVLAMIQVTAEPLHEMRNMRSWEEIIGDIEYRIPKVNGEYYYRFMDFDFNAISQSKELEASFRLFLELINKQGLAEILKGYNTPPIDKEKIAQRESELLRNSILKDERSHQYCNETLRSRVKEEFGE